jgi:NOL1/NOP2/sun family putative RNA methylase
MLSLPEDYIQQMREYLKEDFPAFMETYRHPPVRSLRVNTLKLTPEELAARVPFHLEPVPWCPEGFYYDHERDRPGKHVYHAAGLYYIQDASAMSPAEALDPQPGENVLDLCAAPGGKTTQIAARMKGQGILVANEIDGKRIKALVENLERCGVTNAVVLNEHPERLTSRFRGFFDRILIDAPCSGEGMFRKDPEVYERWSLRLTEKCAVLQSEILDAAAPMLRAGGRLVYSTCTFNAHENEEVIDRFLRDHPEFRLVTVPQFVHFEPGRPEWMETPNASLSRTARLWPHRLRGEGHFVAVLEKTEEVDEPRQKPGKLPPASRDATTWWQTFKEEAGLTVPIMEQGLTLFGEHLYVVPGELPSLKGLKVERPGRYLGQAKKGRFIPSHALALSLRPEEVRQTAAFTANDPHLLLYLQGEALSSQLEKGWTLVTVDGFALGWGKVSDGLLKNHYPKWLRWEKTV